MINKKVLTMEEDLRSWGIGLIVMGGLHFVIPFLATEWGMILIPMGLMSLFIKRRGMFIVIGLSLIIVGLLNIFGSLKVGVGFWPIYGTFQIYWGIKEIAKFGKYGRADINDSFSRDPHSVEIGPINSI